MTDAATILLVGASRGLGLGLAGEFARRGWRVIATVRGTARTPAHDLADASGGGIEIETLDTTRIEEIAALRRRLDGHTLDILFVNAGTTTREANVPMAGIDADEFAQVLLTNALAPMRVIDTLHDLVPDDGVIGAMSSGRGSIANVDRSGNEVYRSSKAALNMLMRCFAAGEAMRSRATLLLAPGWIRTELGGGDAPFTVEDSVAILADILLARRGQTGLAYLDRFGKAVPW